MEQASFSGTSAPPPVGRAVRIAVLGTLVLAAVVRLAGLDRIPPGLWYDEAIYALDGLEAATSGPRIFYTTEDHMREPLYIWSLGGFFALFGHSVAKARLVSALWGIATVAVFWPVIRRAMWEFDARLSGRANVTGSGTGAGTGSPVSPSRTGSPGLRWGIPLPDLWALATLLAFALFRWHVHFSRTIFRALLPSLFLLLIVWLARRWRETGRSRDAVLTGLVLGAGMYTYLSFRLVPLLMLLWAGWLLWRGFLSLSRDGKQLALIAATALLVFAPLGVDWLRHPDHFSGRTEEVSMFTKKVRSVGQEGTSEERVVPKTPAEVMRDLGGNALQVAGMWTFRGDHVGKHNLPYAPVFDWANGLVFYAGLIWCLLRAGRNEWAFLTLLWIAVLSLTSIFSFGAPNILRMQGMTPAVILAYGFGLRWLTRGLARLGASVPVRTAVPAALLTLFAALQLDTYFRRFPVHPAVRQEFQVEMFAAPAEAVRQRARNGSGTIETVLVPQELADHPSFRFITAGLTNVRPYAPDRELPLGDGRPLNVLLTQRSLDLARQAGQDQKAQLYATPGARMLESFPVTVTSPDGTARRLSWGELWLVP